MPRNFIDPQHAYDPDCPCPGCRATLAAITEFDRKPGVNLRVILAASVISLAVTLAIGISIAHARPAQVQPQPAPLALVRERAACTTIQRCRNALERAYAGQEWSKRQRLHQRSLPASNLTPIEIGRELALRHGWAAHEFACLVILWNRESGWQVSDPNPSSQADGIPQANPASKMAAAGADWRTNPATQIRWGLDYIHGRYGEPCAALAHSYSQGNY